MTFGGFQCYPREVGLDAKHPDILSEGSLMAQKSLGSSVWGVPKSSEILGIKLGEEQESIYLLRELQLFNKNRSAKNLERKIGKSCLGFWGVYTCMHVCVCVKSA